MSEVKLDKKVAKLLSKQRDAKVPKGWFTTRELAKAIGICHSAARCKVKKAIEEGLIEYAGQVHRATIDPTKKLPIAHYKFTKKLLSQTE